MSKAMFSWQNTEHLNSSNLERVRHAEITNLGHSQLRGAARQGAVPNCSTSGSGKSSFSHSVTGLVQKVSKPNGLPLPGFVNKQITDWILPPRASPSLHSCAECARRQKFCFYGQREQRSNSNMSQIHTRSSFFQSLQAAIGKQKEIQPTAVVDQITHIQKRSSE